jgi:hypothetical protein
MADAAKYCTPVNSHWINMAILMCDGTLSVYFKDGACCNYPASNPSYYYRMVAAPSPGHYLWQALYRILPYRRIPLPCPAAGCGTVQTTCCANGLPTTLHATLNHGGGSVPLVYDGSQFWTASGILLDCGDTIDLRFTCAPGGGTCGDFTFQFRCNGAPLWASMTIALGCSCNPLSLHYSGALTALEGCTNCASALGPLTALVTT